MCTRIFVVDHVDCSVFLSHLKLEDTVERLPSRYLALSLCLEDVKAQCDSLTPQTRERLQGILSQREVDISTNHPSLHVFRWMTVTRMMILQLKQIVSCPPLPKILLRNDLLSERFALLLLKVIHFLVPWKQLVKTTKWNLRDTSTSSSSSRKEVLVPRCLLCSKPMIRRQHRVNKGSFWGCQQWPMCNGTRRPWERGKDETSTIFAAAQFLDSSCADCWNRAVRFGRPNLLEILRLW